MAPLVNRVSPLMFLVTACGITSPDGSIPESPSLLIVDARHGNGNPRFFFLPPMVSEPQVTGTFDPTLEPTATVCRLTGTDCGEVLATFTGSSGPGGETIRLDAQGQLYQFNWHTTHFDLETGTTYRIIIRAGSVQLGFADVQLVSTGKEVRNVATGQFVPLLDGRTLPVKFRIETGIFPVRLAVVSGEGQTGLPGTPLALPIVLVVTDQSGYPLAGVEVSLTPSAGATGATQLLTDDQGRISTSWTLGLSTGTQTLEASALGQSLTITATATEPLLPGRLVFTSSRTGDYEIYSMATDGSDVRRLTDSPGYDSQVGGSRDGTRIAFTSGRTGGGDVWIMNADGTNPTRLTFWGEYTQMPVWGPADAKILINSNTQGGGFDLFVIDIDGSNAHRLTNTPEEEHEPDWSPDGTRIVYSLEGNGLGMIAANGTGLPSVYSGSAWAPRWSPDGETIAFASYRDGTGGEIYMINPDGTNLRRVTFLGGFHLPVWSPDGSHLATLCTFGGDEEVCIMRADGSGLRRITTSPGSDWVEAWLP